MRIETSLKQNLAKPNFFMKVENSKKIKQYIFKTVFSTR